MSGRHRDIWLLFTAVACATTSRSGYNQTRATEYVYAGGPEPLVDAATQLLTDQGLRPIRLDARTVQTAWVRQGGQTPRSLAGDELAPRSFQSYRFEVTAVDAAHQTVKIERLTTFGAPLTLRGTSSEPLEQTLDARLDPGAATPGTAKPQRALATPGGDANPPTREREPALEWALLQKVDPTAAGFIEQEPTTASGCSQVKAPTKPPPDLLRMASACPDVPGAIELLVSRRLIILGELQGTEQSPAFAGAVACRAVAEGWPVAVALELPEADNSALQVFLESKGTAADREAYVATASWKRDWHDGRSSVAMLGLVEQLRKLKAAGGDIEIRGIDDRRWVGDDREAAMATHVDAMRRRLLDRPMVVMVGNLHADTRPDQVARGYAPLGARLERFGLRPVALVMSYDAGTIWACTLQGGLGCGVHPVKGWPPPERSAHLETAGEQASKWGGMGAAGDAAPSTPRYPGSIRVWPNRSNGIDGLYYVGAVTASRPP